ncbi:hypothetical protein M0804_002234 [Polistes exclamans]|nr:hypothetical protein M0804_002234 [Polistes exclamans]
MEYTREPCPWRVIDDCGGAFAMGLIGGSLFQSFIGFRNAPSGFRRRLYGGLTAVKTRGPQVAGNFAVWGGLFSAFECTLIRCRSKEDPWNSIMSGALTGGVLAARTGIPSMLGSATFGGFLLAVIEGVGIMVTRLQADFFAQHNSVYELEQVPTGKRFVYTGNVSSNVERQSNNVPTNLELERIAKIW